MTELLVENILFIVAFFSTILTHSQIILNNDTTVCGLQNFTLNAISADVDSLIVDDAYTDVRRPAAGFRVQL